MTDDSQNIARIFRQVRQFYRDVSLLLRTGDDIFKEAGWTPIGLNKNSLHFESLSYEHPDKWLPDRIYRSYEHKKHPHRLAYLAVLIDIPSDGKRAGTTLVSAGCLKYEKPKGWGNGIGSKATELYRWHLYCPNREDDGEPVLHHARDETLPANWKDRTKGIHSALTVGRPVHEVTGTAELEALINKLLHSAVGKSPNGKG